MGTLQDYRFMFVFVVFWEEMDAPSSRDLQPPLLPDEWAEKAGREARVRAALQTWDIEVLLQGLRAYLRRRGTRQPEYYLWTARNFLAYLAVRDRVWPEVEAGDLEAFLEDLALQGPPLGEGRRRRLSPASLRKAWRGLRHFADFLAWAGLKWPAHLRFPPQPSLEVRGIPLSDEEWKQLLQAAAQYPLPAWRVFLQAVLYLLIEGVRVNELLTLRLADLELSQRRLTVRGRRPREIPLEAATCRALQTWLEEREALALLQGISFPQLLLRPARWRGGSRGRPVTRPVLTEAVHGLFALAQVKGPPMRRLQWTAIRRALQHGEHPTRVALRVGLARLPRWL